MVVNVQNDIDSAAAAAQRVVDIHFRTAEFLRPGLTLADIDSFISKQLADLRCTSAFLNYRMSGLTPFPSYSCLSVNDCVVHGQHNMAAPALKPGDIISIDIGVNHFGWIGDAAFTYAIKEASPLVLKLMHCGRESLRRGIQAIRAGRPLIDWAKAVQQYVEKECGFHVVRNLGGHGYGRKLHGPPFVSNALPSNPNSRAEWPDAWTLFKTGQLLALEPMIAVGSPYVKSKPGEWPFFTEDGSLAVHYEANVLVTDFGPRNLTEGMEKLPDIVG